MAPPSKFLTRETSGKRRRGRGRAFCHQASRNGPAPRTNSYERAARFFSRHCQQSCVSERESTTDTCAAEGLSFPPAETTGWRTSGEVKGLHVNTFRTKPADRWNRLWLGV